MQDLLKPLATAFVATALVGGGMAVPAFAGGDKYDHKSWEKKDKDDCDDWDYYYKWKNGHKVKVWYCDDDDDDHHKRYNHKHGNKHHSHKYNDRHHKHHSHKYNDRHHHDKDWKDKKNDKGGKYKHDGKKSHYKAYKG